jgi:hypothetical protein
LRELSAGAGPGDIRQLLEDEVTGHFGMSAGVVETGPIADRLTTWWKAEQR